MEINVLLKWIQETEAASLLGGGRIAVDREGDPLNGGHGQAPSNDTGTKDIPPS